ncbi:hypothetical protein B0H11DRAFT_2251888 [Mycena galericulata]|nr:hypothetical protein B0H11DRAFT_2251888 [Mycena galericulata]
MPRIVPGRTSPAKPYARPSSTPFDQMAAARRNVQLFDINANRPGKNADSPAIAILVDDKGLKAMKAYQILGIPCSKCNLLVGVFGFGEYSPHPNGEIHPTYHMCKGCYAYSIFNPVGKWDDPPACTCPPGAIANDLDTGCKLHVVPSITALPLGVTDVSRPVDPSVAKEILDKRVDDARAAVNALKADTEEYVAAQERLDKVWDDRMSFNFMSYHSFKMPPAPPSQPPRVLIAPARMPTPRVFAPKIPHGHPYDFNAQRRREWTEDPVAEKFNSYEKYT